MLWYEIFCYMSFARTRRGKAKTEKLNSDVYWVQYEEMNFGRPFKFKKIKIDKRALLINNAL